MTDQERARTFVVGLTPRGLIEAESITEALLGEFTAVRLDERRAIVAFLRAAAPTRKRGAAALIAAADLIERRVDGS